MSSIADDVQVQVSITLSRLLYLSFAPIFQSVEWEIEIFPFIGKVLTGEKVQVRFLYIQSSTKFLLHVSAKGIRKECRILDISVKLCGGIM